MHTVFSVRQTATTFMTLYDFNSTQCNPHSQFSNAVAYNILKDDCSHTFSLTPFLKVESLFPSHEYKEHAMNKKAKVFNGPHVFCRMSDQEYVKHAFAFLIPLYIYYQLEPTFSRLYWCYWRVWNKPERHSWAFTKRSQSLIKLMWGFSLYRLPIENVTVITIDRTSTMLSHSLNARSSPHQCVSFGPVHAGILDTSPSMTSIGLGLKWHALTKVVSIWLSYVQRCSRESHRLFAMVCQEGNSFAFLGGSWQTIQWLLMCIRDFIVY